MPEEDSTDDSSQTSLVEFTRDRYDSIVSREVFGPTPEGFDPEKTPDEAKPVKKDKEREKLEDSVKSSVRFSSINVTPSGAVAVGFTDKSQNPPKSYYMRVDETCDKWKVLAADPLTASMTLLNVSEDIEVNLTIGGDSSKDKEATQRRSAPVAPQNAGGLRSRRMRRDEERRQWQEAEERHRQEDARRQEEDRANKEEEARQREENEKKQFEMSEQLVKLKEQLEKVREEREEREKREAETNGNDEEETEKSDET